MALPPALPIFSPHTLVYHIAMYYTIGVAWMSGASTFERRILFEVVFFSSAKSTTQPSVLVQVLRITSQRHERGGFSGTLGQ
jgi:hypothetical protein